MPARRNRGKSKVGNDYGSSSRAAARAAAEPAADERAEPAVEQRDDEGARRLDDFLTLSGRFSVAGFGRVRLDARTCACGSQGRLAFGVLHTYHSIERCKKDIRSIVLNINPSHILRRVAPRCG